MNGPPASRRTVPVRLVTSPFMRLASIVLRGVFGATARVRYVGPAVLPRHGPLLVVANHTSNIDPPLLAAWLQPRLGRPIHFLAKEQLFVAALRPLLDQAGAIRVRAGGSDVQAYRDALTVLRQGGVVGLLPEGTRSPDGVLGDPHPGVAMLAMRSGVPILPVGISGAQHYLPRRGWRPALGTPITIHVGPPFTIDAGRPADGRGGVQRSRALGSIDDRDHEPPGGAAGRRPTRPLGQRRGDRAAARRTGHPARGGRAAAGGFGRFAARSAARVVTRAAAADAIAPGRVARSPRTIAACRTGPQARRAILGVPCLASNRS
jgi:1-acyl-sn-glycerol-3-phosphate acyltransferase